MTFARISSLAVVTMAVLAAGTGVAGAGSGEEADAEVMVRVRLLEIDGPVIVEGPGLGRRKIEPTGRGLRVDGGAPLRRWRADGAGKTLWVGGAAGRGKRGASSGGGFRVQGALVVLPVDGGLAVVNKVPMERYVAGTLGAEMYSSWREDALRAQAVACRTYALYQIASHRNEEWDLSAGTGSQVYRGVAAETPTVRAAVESTRREVLVHAGEPALAVYHSASGGRTASAEEVWGKDVPYLKSVEVEHEEDSPDTYWRVEISTAKLGRILADSGHSVGPVRRVEVTERSKSGRVLEIELRGKRGRVRLTGRELRSAMGDETLRSTLFEVREGDESVVFVGTGRGHGVGMSQWGAQAMAVRGRGYREILRHFYPGTHLRKLDGRGVVAASRTSSVEAAVGRTGQ